MLKKIIIIFIILFLLGAGAYYWFFLRIAPAPIGDNEEAPSGFSFNPFRRSTVTPPATTTFSSSTSTPDTSTETTARRLPALRHLSTTPIGGYMASTTASSTVVRYIDRGVGHVHESLSINEAINKISNTTIPKIYESYWNKNLNATILRYIKDDKGAIANFYAEIRPIKVSSTTPITSDFIPYEIKGKFLSSDIREIAVSPKKDRIFTLNIENGKGVGYISGFDESKKTKVLDIPITQANIEWPEENTILITNKASGVSSGFAYIFDIKKGTLTKILGGITGLTAKMSADAKKIIFTSTRGLGIFTSIYTIKDASTREQVFRTFTDKCVWSRLRTDEIYCAVPSILDKAVYPDSWYRGSISFVDQIWHLDTTTGEVHLLANLLELSGDLIDATDLTLDPKENFLYFINKNDLTLWSLDLNE